MLGRLHPANDPRPHGQPALKNQRVTGSAIAQSHNFTYLYGHEAQRQSVAVEERATGTWEKPYKCNGKEIDEETGLYYVHARYRNPQHPTWLNIDPLHLEFPEVSAYVFCHANPINRVDMDGRADYYINGDWVSSDNIDDGKVYHNDANGNITYGVGVLSETQFSEWNYKIKDSSFEEYFPTLIQHEGGYVDHPNDPGGATNKGITFNTFKKYSVELLSVNPTLNNLKNLSNSQASAIYEVGYWNISGAGQISDKQIGWLHFDTYVHGGASSVLKSTNNHYKKNDNSIRTLNSILLTTPPKDVFETYKQERLLRFERLIDENPRLDSFRKGWENRVNKFQYK